ncbi:MAG: glutamate--tRNA ligase, partial [Gemmatimonadota bacterium]
YEALGAPPPQFAHLPMIHGTDGKKLSKRQGATAVGDYQHLGILPQAMVNFLALLGWSPGGEFEEVMTLDQLIHAFSEDGLLRKASVFDPKKLEWMNGQHLSQLPIAELEPRVTPALVAAGYTTAEHLATHHEWSRTLLDLLRVRSRLIDDIVRQAGPYFVDAITYDPEAVAKQWKEPAVVLPLLTATRETLAALPEWTPPVMEEALRHLAEAKGVGGGTIFQPLRVALTGLTVSPGIFDVMVLLGRERTLARIASAEDHLETLASA